MEQQKEVKFVIMNRTDGIPAGFYEWDTYEEAEACIAQMRENFRKAQGYYKTNRGERIDPNDVVYEILKQEKEDEDDQ